MTDAEAVVRRLCAAMSAQDLEAVRPLLSRSAVYHNVGMEPAVGVDASLDAVAAQFAMFDRIEFQVRNLAVTGTTVLTERVDVVSANGIEAPVPVMGAFEIHDGRIASWRDYFDVGLVGRLLSGEDVAALLPT